MESFTSIKYYTKKYTDLTWTEITDDVSTSSPPRGFVGMSGSSILDRVGDGGSMTIRINNNSGDYDPGDASGNYLRMIAMFKWVVEWESQTKVMFLGFHDVGTLKDGVLSNGDRYMEITYRDWMAYAIEYQLDFLQYQTSKTIDEAVQHILDTLPLQPTYKNFTAGHYTFPDVFDITGQETTAGGEFTKLANSEFGYIYHRFGKPDGGQLEVLSRESRRDLTLTQLPVYSGDHSGDHLLLESGDGLLLEDGSYLLLEESGTIVMSLDDLDYTDNLGRTYFGKYFNYVRMTTHPRSVDAANTTVLWTMEGSKAIPAGQTVTGIRGRYRDPSGGASYVNGKDMITPVATTDYKAYEFEDGTGTDFTANMVVTAEFGSAEAEFSIENTGGTEFFTGGGDILFQVRGRGVYQYDTVESVVDAISTANNGLLQPFGGRMSLSYDMAYQNDDTDAKLLFSVGGNWWKAQPSREFETVPLLANRNAKNMRLFFYGGINTKFSLSAKAEADSVSADYQKYFIQGYSFEIVANQLIKWTPILFHAFRVPNSNQW